MKKTLFIITIALFSLSVYSQNHYKLGKKVSKNDVSQIISIKDIECNLGYNIIDKDIAYGLTISPTKKPCDDKLAQEFIKEIRKEYKIKNKKQFIFPTRKDLFTIIKETKECKYTIAYEKIKDNEVKVMLYIINGALIKKVQREK